MTSVNGLLHEVAMGWASALQTAIYEGTENARNALQFKLNSQDPDSFPMNGAYTDINHLLIKLLEDESGNQVHHTNKCGNCDRTVRPLVRSSTWSLPVQEVQQNLTTEIKHRFNRPSTQPCHCQH